MVHMYISVQNVKYNDTLTPYDLQDQRAPIAGYGTLHPLTPSHAIRCPFICRYIRHTQSPYLPDGAPHVQYPKAKKAVVRESKKWYLTTKSDQENLWCVVHDY
jgi:hypothetical protein